LTDGGAVRPGENVVRIENLEEDGVVGEIPWILVNNVTIYYR
jgi:hypothetical protein